MSKPNGTPPKGAGIKRERPPASRLADELVMNQIKPHECLNLCGEYLLMVAADQVIFDHWKPNEEEKLAIVRAANAIQDAMSWLRKPGIKGRL